jgi:hypothetical protein
MTHGRSAPFSRAAHPTEIEKTRYSRLVLVNTQLNEESKMRDAAISIVRGAYQAYVDKYRAAIEAVIGDDFHFTSPRDNRINREVYFDKCWKNSDTITGFTLTMTATFEEFPREPRSR